MLTDQKTQEAIARARAERRPLASVETCKWMLDLSEDDVIAELEEGSLAWAWDLASPKANRRTIRILSRSLEDYAAGRPAWDGEIGEAIELILESKNRQRFTCSELCRAFNCSATHVLDLIRDGALSAIPGSPWGRGPGNSPIIDRATVVAFLEKRRIA